MTTSLPLVQQMIDRGILFDDAQREFERMFITRALAKTNYNVCKAAKMTGLHRNTLSRKMAAYKIKKDRVVSTCSSTVRLVRQVRQVERNLHSDQLLWENPTKVGRR